MLTRSASGACSVLAAVALAGLLSLPGLPGLSGSGSGQAVAASPSWHSMGRTWAPSGVLRRSCHKYPYHYRISPPTKNWSLETFLRGPAGKRLASDVILSGADPKRGTKRFDLCRSNTRPGRFTIRAKLTDSDFSGSRSGWLRPSHFRLHR